MRIHNVRLGLATNSSSSHSVIFRDGIKDESPDSDGGYGWENFTLASRNAKARYLGVALRDQLARMTSPEIAATVVKAWLGVESHNGDYIDHESHFGFPLDWSGLGVDKKFFDAFAARLLDSNAAILGGNDNEDPHPLRGKGAITLDRLGMNGSVARRDEAGGYWSLFRRDNGTKVRLSFDLDSIAPKKASSPELVDVKITDYCATGCGYCYQGSTKEGKHADMSYLCRLAHECGKARVFEVAIGGGEPTTHPKFLEILYYFWSHGVVPNFTTRETKWLSNKPFREEVLKHCGAVAFSFTEVATLSRLLAKHNFPHERAVIHYIVGADHGLPEVLAAAYHHQLAVTLLGFKTTGRGAKYPSRKEDWAAAVQALESNCPRISIDTALAAESGDALARLDVPKWCYHVEEGAFSMYIDAVAQTAAPSSYSGKPVPLPKPEALVSVFTAF